MSHRKLIQKHRGNLSAAAREQKISRQYLTSLLSEAEVLLASQLRARSCVGGPRADMSARDAARDRKLVLEQLAQSGSFRAAADVLGVSKRTLYRRARAYGLTREIVKAAR